MKWLKDLFRETFPPIGEENSKDKKNFDEIYNELGAFHYDEEGFTIKHNNFIDRIKWEDIKQLNVYKSDLMTIDCVEMEIIYRDKRITITEELPGWFQFVLKSKEIFPSIPKDWDITIIHPAFATNYKTIYDKDKVETKIMIISTK
jgi:negative regulator of sigma E activity